MTILIVDDDPEQLNLRSMVLAQSGFETVLAGDAAEAKELAMRHRPHAAVVDLRLPRVSDGLELLRSLRLEHTGMKLIVLTGCSRESVMNTAESSWVTRYSLSPLLHVT